MTLKEREQYLLQKIRNGDIRAYDQLITPLLPRLKRKAMSMITDLSKDPDLDSEDILQDALISGYKSIQNFRADSGIYTWLYRIVINKAKDFRSKTIRQNEIPISENEHLIPDNRMGFEKKLEQIEDQEYLNKMIESLDDIYKEVFELRFYERMTYSQIATVLNCNVGTVKSRLFKARELLKHKFI
ncbi:MAG: RNA polymerase sigma factor [Leptospiraceae bacterium]|nr:RNA polymerase sigma factor [Leptospiraceae bacterium]MCP5511985.1 RNA polymerase sigma factor [Leptospiraceae bacterium]